MTDFVMGVYRNIEKECSVIKIQTESIINIWQKNIADEVYYKWLNLNDKSERTQSN